MNRYIKLIIALCLFLPPVLLVACTAAPRSAAPTQAAALVTTVSPAPTAGDSTAAKKHLPATITRAAPKALPTLVASSTPLPSRTPIPSFTPFSTSTFSPTRTLTPTGTLTAVPTITTAPTKFPPLVAGWPFLVYYTETKGVPGIALVNANAAGKSVLPLPDSSRQPWLPDSLSPNGEWLAFHTGTTGAGAVPDGSQKYDLTLNLLHLPDGKVQSVSPLLSAQYPNDLKALAAKVTSTENGVTISDQTLFTFFRTGITALQWSPDGKSLAFAGQMDGPGSEVYLYDLASGKIRALTSGSSEQIQWLFWSPDGRYLVVGRRNGQCSNDCTTRWAIDVAKGELKQLPKLIANGAVQIYDWASPTRLTYYGYGNGYKGFLQTVDIATGEISSLYQNVFNTFAQDTETQLLALNLSYDAEKGKPVEPGIYLDTLEQNDVKLVASFAKYGNLKIRFWGHPTNRFIAWSENKIYALTAQGEMRPLADAKFLGLSPDHQKVLVIGGTKTQPKPDPKATPDNPVIPEEKATLLLLDANGATIKELPYREELTGANTSLIFAPDSSGVFLASPQGLYYLGWSLGKWVQIDPALPVRNWTWPGTLPFGWKK